VRRNMMFRLLLSMVAISVTYASGEDMPRTTVMSFPIVTRTQCPSRSQKCPAGR